MRIAQVAPLCESCPPQLYGGTERVVSILTEELVRQGHEVTLFASGDSVTGAKLVSPCKQALRLNAECQDPLAYHMMLVHRIARSAHLFDVIHFHIDYLHFPSFAPTWRKTLTTLHGRLDLPDLAPLMREFSMMPLVSISNAQRAPLAWANWYGTVYHGLPRDLYGLGRGAGGYLAFIGRISPEKGPERAIEIARRAGLPLIIAAKVDRVDREYYKARVEPLLNDPLIEYIGEVDDAEKRALLADATAVLFPIDWPEPFGLVLIEAMACGTPAIAFRRGAVAEIIEQGRTGLVVDSIEEAVAAIPVVQGLDRVKIREAFEERFLVDRMARDYVALYGDLLRRSEADGTQHRTAAEAGDG
ncbi:MAG TPA: glycosyltransferase family 4 protein [Stellaceae bacterium]|nr:glycosyltransferase family 4 protein [Stellaceae bacterium]